MQEQYERTFDNDVNSIISTIYCIQSTDTNIRDTKMS